MHRVHLAASSTLVFARQSTNRRLGCQPWTRTVLQSDLDFLFQHYRHINFIMRSFADYIIIWYIDARPGYVILLTSAVLCAGHIVSTACKSKVSGSDRLENSRSPELVENRRNQKICISLPLQRDNGDSQREKALEMADSTDHSWFPYARNARST